MAILVRMEREQISLVCGQSAQKTPNGAWSRRDRETMSRGHIKSFWRTDTSRQKNSIDQKIFEFKAQKWVKSELVLRVAFVFHAPCCLVWQCGGVFVAG